MQRVMACWQLGSAWNPAQSQDSYIPTWLFRDPFDIEGWFLWNFCLYFCVWGQKVVGGPASHANGGGRRPPSNFRHYTQNSCKQHSKTNGAAQNYNGIQLFLKPNGGWSFHSVKLIYIFMILLPLPGAWSATKKCAPPSPLEADFPDFFFF